jgi:hypothetical protein
MQPARSTRNGPTNADEFLSLTHRILPKLWRIHGLVGDREFRLYLNAAERLRADVAPGDSGDAQSSRPEGAEA